MRIRKSAKRNLSNSDLTTRGNLVRNTRITPSALKKSEPYTKLAGSTELES